MAETSTLKNGLAETSVHQNNTLILVMVNGDIFFCCVSLQKFISNNSADIFMFVLTCCFYVIFFIGFVRLALSISNDFYKSLPKATSILSALVIIPGILSPPVIELV